MKITIEYCAAWNYLPRATSLVEKMKEDLNLSAELIKSDGGVYEITMNGELIYSKRKTGVFPEESEIIDKVRERMWYMRRPTGWP